MQLPKVFKENFTKLLGADQFLKYENSLENLPYLGVRVNLLKISTEKFIKVCGIVPETVDWCKEGYYVKDLCLSKSPFYFAGLFYLQEPSAMLPVSIMPIEKNDCVLDLCASPGGKSTHIAAKLNGTGALLSNDANPSRISPLIKNIEQLGIRNAVVTNETAERLNAYFGAFFDKILIDAPCSGEGMFRKDKDSVLAWDEKKSDRLRHIQRELLEYGAKMLKTGGMLMYSTCTFSPLENEMQILLFLRSHPEFQILPVNHDLGISKGRADWADDDERLTNAARIFPHLQKGEGHFMALLQKTDKTPGENKKKNISFLPSKIKGIEYFQDFCNNQFYEQKQFAVEQVKVFKDLLYCPPDMLSDCSGLRVSRGGFCLGHIKEKRFEPVGAFASGLPKEQFKRLIDFTHDSEEIMRFLKGEAFDVNAPDGYHAICVDGYPLDFVKITNGRLKWRARGIAVK